MPLDVLILRDPREATKKCSLTPLRGTSGIQFVTYDGTRRLEAGRRLYLAPEGELLSERDRGLPLLLIDCAWRKVPALLKTVDGELLPRRLPPLATAYPRKSMVFEDPHEGLASVEALYAALALLGEVHPELLAGYHWREQFLAANPTLPR